MSKSNSFWITIRNVLSKPFYFVASAVSILALIPAFCGSTYAVITSLGVFCLVLIFILISILQAVHKIIGRANVEPFKKISTQMTYKTSDGKNIVFEVFKVIQCKRLILTFIDYQFKWSGSIMPNITSSLQTVTKVHDSNNPNEFDKATLTFNNPLYYDQNKVVHFRAELDDTDGVSSPHLMARVDDAIDLIHFKVTLLHKPKNFSSNAYLERGKIGSAVNAPYERLRDVSFDRVSKTYEYILLNPDVGYLYRLCWIK